MSPPVLAATPAHAAVLAAIHAAAFPPDEAWGWEVMAVHLGLPGTFGLLDERGGMLLVRLAADESELLTLAVQPHRRREGVAARLLRSAMAEARTRGASVMFLEVATNNDPARSLYTRAGFTEVGRRPRYYADGLDALVLRADLA